MSTRPTPKQHGEGSNKSFTAAGRRLDSPPAMLIKALRELGDTESEDRLAEAYPARARRSLKTGIS